MTAVGLGLLAIAVLWPGAGIERFFGREPGSLSWGPALFRALLALHGAALLAWAYLRRQGDEGRANPAVRERFPVAAMAALTVAAVALRLWRLDTGLWFDELLTLLDFVRAPFGVIFTSFPSQNQHMLYSLMARACFAVFGESAWALRLPAVFFGVASIWAVFLLGRRIIGTAGALMACALMTVSYHHIWFSQNARGYTGLLFFGTLATWLWLEALDRRSARWWIAYAVSAFLGLWVHMTIVFVLAAQGLLWLAMRLSPGASVEKQAGWQPVLAWTLGATLTLQALALSLPEFLRSALHEVSLESEWTNPLWVVMETVRSLKIGWSGAGVLLAGAAMLAVGYLGILRKDWRAGALMALAPALGGGSMLALGHNLWPRFFFFAMGFALIVAVHGAMTAPGLILRGARGRQAGLALAGLMIAASAVTVPKVYALPKQDFAGARDWVEAQRRPGEAIVAVGLAGRAYGSYLAPHWTVAESVKDLEEAMRTHSAVWLVYTLPIHVRAYHPDIWGGIESGFEIVRVFYGTLGGGEVYVCRTREPLTHAGHSEGRIP